MSLAPRLLLVLLVALLPVSTSLTMPRRPEVSIPRPSFDGAREAMQRQGRAIKSYLPWYDAAKAAALGSMRVPVYAVGHAYTSGLDLLYSLPSNQPRGKKSAFEDEASEKRRAWMGFAAGGLCELASVGLAGLCTSLACAEVAARAAKVASGVLAAQLAECARLGSAAARLELDFHGHGARGVASAMARAGAEAAAAEPNDADEAHAHEHAPPHDDELHAHDHADYDHHHHHHHEHAEPGYEEEEEEREPPPSRRGGYEGDDHQDDPEPHETIPRAVDWMPMPPPKWRAVSSVVIWA